MSRLSKPPETYNIDEISETDEIRKIVELVQKLKTCDYVDKDNIGVRGFLLVLLRAGT